LQIDSDQFPQTMKTQVMLITLIIISLSCKKEVDYADFVTIGETAHMSITQYDSIYDIRFDFTPFGVDIDDDNMDDFRIEPYHALFHGYFPSARLVCLDENLYLSKVDVRDTTYYASKVDTSRTGGHVVISTSQKYYCANRPDAGKLRTDPQEHLRDYYEGDIISKEDSWKSSEFVFANTGYEPFNTYYDGWANDTVRIYYYTYYNNCYLLPTNEDVWVGFKKVNGQRERIGWLKFNIFKEGEDTRLYLKEIAKQK